jgi:hypothetical protein
MHKTIHPQPSPGALQTEQSATLDRVFSLCVVGGASAAAAAEPDVTHDRDDDSDSDGSDSGSDDADPDGASRHFARTLRPLMDALRSPLCPVRGGAVVVDLYWRCAVIATAICVAGIIRNLTVVEPLDAAAAGIKRDVDADAAPSSSSSSSSSAAASTAAATSIGTSSSSPSSSVASPLPQSFLAYLCASDDLRYLAEIAVAKRPRPRPGCAPAGTGSPVKHAPAIRELQAVVRDLRPFPYAALGLDPYIALDGQLLPSPHALGISWSAFAAPINPAVSAASATAANSANTASTANTVNTANTANSFPETAIRSLLALEKDWSLSDLVKSLSSEARAADPAYSSLGHPPGLPLLLPLLHTGMPRDWPAQWSSAPLEALAIALSSSQQAPVPALATHTAALIRADTSKRRAAGEAPGPRRCPIGDQGGSLVRFVRAAAIGLLGPNAAAADRALAAVFGDAARPDRANAWVSTLAFRMRGFADSS